MCYSVHSWFILVSASCALLLPLVAVVCTVGLGQVVDGVIRNVHALTDTLCTCSVSYWERAVEISQCDCLSVSSHSFISFLLNVFWSVLLSVKRSHDCCFLLMLWPFSHMKWPLLSLVLFSSVLSVLMLILDILTNVYMVFF